MSEVIWHDLECGGYTEDLSLWTSLADQAGGPILEIGAGTGRVSIALARAGHQVTALDHDGELLDELSHRADGLELRTVRADARSFQLHTRFALCLVPMQAIQLFGGASGRRAFLQCAHQHLAPGGMLAAALADGLELFEAGPGMPTPLPDMCELDGVVYSSVPVAVRDDGDGFVLERRRETVRSDGARTCDHNSIRLDRLSTDELEREAAAVGLRPLPRRRVAASEEYVGSEVVIVGA